MVKIFIIVNIAYTMINFRKEFIEILVPSEYEVYYLVGDYNEESRKK